MEDTVGQPLYERFLTGLQISPRRAAVRAGGRTVSYEEAHETALGWAGDLLAGADRPPRAVGVLTGKGADSYLALLAGLYSGATLVPLHADFPAARTRRMLEDSGVSAVIADARGLAALGETGLDLPVLVAGEDAGGPTALRRIARGARPLDAPRPVTPGDPAYVLFTSGSTGRPKGVPITHASAQHYFQLMDKRYDFTEEDVFSQTFDLNFDCAMFDLFCAWGAGATVDSIPVQGFRDLPEYIARSGMTVWFSTPSAITLLRRLGGLNPGSMPGLRWSLFAGEALRQDDAADWQAAAANSTLENIYGPTELTITITGHRWEPSTSPDLCVNGLVPIGSVHEGHDHLLLDPEGRPTGTEGELLITGPQLTAGYINPSDDEGRFLEHEGSRYYRTGDRVRRLPDGELIYLGRLDSQVQVQGWRVELAEVEHAARGCEGVQDAVAVTRTTDAGGELVVFYTGEPTPAAALARELRAVLPTGMLPRYFRHLEQFPLNSNRKTDRKELAAQAAALP
ncbi:AMP-binding protein [Streptomyces sp. NPDC051109]|uniref:AMP-binding protein n=1 Tax=Streptomyces sp. NPDC051109 TaxID=3365642 RepID=UPI0037B8CD78